VADLIAQDQLLVDLVDQVVVELLVVPAALEQWGKDLLAEVQPPQIAVGVVVVPVT
jgi:hypothetical protein